MITISNCARIEKYEVEKVTSYPNPVNEEIIIVLGDDVYAKAIMLTDNLGRVVMNRKLTDDEHGNLINLNVSDVGFGLYLLHIDIGTELIIKKVVIER